MYYLNIYSFYSSVISRWVWWYNRQNWGYQEKTVGKKDHLFGISKLSFRSFWIPKWKRVCFRQCDLGWNTELRKAAAQATRSTPTRLTGGANALGEEEQHPEHSQQAGCVPASCSPFSELWIGVNCSLGGFYRRDRVVVGLWGGFVCLFLFFFFRENSVMLPNAHSAS